MSKVFAITYTIILGLFVCALLGLYVWCYFMQPFWKNNKGGTDSAKAATRILFACATCYMVSNVLALLVLIVFLATDYSTAEFVYFIFSVFYALSLFLMLYVWIKRLESTFVNSAYELSAKFIKFLKILFYVVIILALITLVAYIANGGGDDNQDGALTIIASVMSVIFALAFVTLITVLLYSFISKLNQLRKVAENRLEKANNSGDYDLESIGVIQKLIKLQLKLTIAAIVSIISTFIIIILQVIFNVDEEWEVITFSIDTILGFLCIHCTLKTHNTYYEYLCKLCITTCDLCFNTTQLDTQLKHHIAVHSRSGAQGDGSSGVGTSAIIFASEDRKNGDDESNATQQQHQPRPSNNVTVLSTYDDNQRREITDDPSNTQTND